MYTCFWIACIRSVVLLWLQLGGIFGASRVLNRLHVNVKGTKWSNGSHGSLKTPLVLCVLYFNSDRIF